MDIFTASFWFPDRVLCVIYTAFGIGVSTDNGKFLIIPPNSANAPHLVSKLPSGGRPKDQEPLSLFPMSVQVR